MRAWGVARRQGSPDHAARARCPTAAGLHQGASRPSSLVGNGSGRPLPPGHPPGPHRVAHGWQHLRMIKKGCGVAWSLMFVLLLLVGGCARESQIAWESPVERAHPLVGRIWDVKAGSVISEET